MLSPFTEEEDLQSNGTLADLLLTMVAVILLILIMLIPHIDFSAPSSAQASQTDQIQTLTQLHLTQQGAPLSTLIVAQDGIHLNDTAKTLIPSDRISEDKTLDAFLTRLKETRSPLLLLIMPDGLENAFQLEPLLASHQPLTLRQVRLDKKCQFAKEKAPLAACRNLL